MGKTIGRGGKIHYIKENNIRELAGSGRQPFDCKDIIEDKYLYLGNSNIMSPNSYMK